MGEWDIGHRNVTKSGDVEGRDDTNGSLPRYLWINRRIIHLIHVSLSLHSEARLGRLKWRMFLPVPRRNREEVRIPGAVVSKVNDSKLPSR